MLEVRLLGELEAQARGSVLPPPAHPQGPELLAWLALHPGEQERGPIAALLWPGLPRANARSELRSAAWALRRMLGPDEGLVLDGRDTIGLRCTHRPAGVRAPRGRRRRRGARSRCAAASCWPASADEHGWVLAARAEHAARVEACGAVTRGRTPALTRRR